MELLTIPFENDFIIYRPLRAIAFIGNQSLVSYIRGRIAGDREPLDNETGAFLNDIGFWEPDADAPQAWTPEAEHRPTTAVLLMTSACNLRCTYCYAHGGGEPTANWEVLQQAVKYARDQELPCEISMSTNGVLPKTKRDFVIENFDGVSLSFDGIREVQDVQRPLPNGGGSFDHVMRTIHAFDDQQFRYGLRLTVTAKFFHTIPESVRFLCENCLCPTFQIEPAFSAGRGDHTDPGAEESDAFVHAFLQAFDEAAQYGRTAFYSGARPWTVTSSFCSAAKDALIVNPTGNLVTCFEIHDEGHSLSEDFTIGRVTTDESGEFDPLPIINNNGNCGAGHAECGGKVFIDDESLRQFVAKDGLRRSECTECFAYWHCAGDCATRRSASTTKDYGRCHVNREITKEILVRYIAEGDGLWCGEARVVCARWRRTAASPP